MSDDAFSAEPAVSEMANKTAVPSSPDLIPAARSSWGACATILLVVVAEAIRAIVDVGLDQPLLESLGAAYYFWHVVIITLSWAVPIVVLAIAVRLSGVSIRDHFGWKRPRPADVVFAIGAILLLEALSVGLVRLALGRFDFPVDEYRASIAAGMSPWWYVLRMWPAFVYAPFVEETTYRGFLWRGIAASRLGNPGALLLTSFFFACVHWRYYLQAGQFDAGAFISPFVGGLVLGWIRWRTGSTIACMLGHSLSNLLVPIGSVMAASL